MNLSQVWYLVWVCSCSLLVVSHGTEVRWDEVQPIGCAEVGDAKGRWCEVHSDGSVTLRNTKILKDKIRTGSKKLTGGKGYEGLEAELGCANAALAAIEDADARYAKTEAQRLKAIKAADLKRQRLPSQYRCRKNAKVRDRAEYHCTVTDYKMESRGGKDGGGDDGKQGAGAGAPEVSDDDRCKELLEWLSKFQADKTEGKTAFWRYLHKAHDDFAELEKLKTHSLKYGTGTGKVLAAIETKSAKLYKKISKELHPDKQVRFFTKVSKCAARKEALVEMLKAAFDRAADLKKCILKPLRCELPEELGARAGAADEL